MVPVRKIIHVDMDAFYASVEQRDRPGLRGKPVIVGGDPLHRGVVAACSYEARRFGIRSAMPGKTACRLCPQAVFLRPRFDVYRAVSAQIRGIFHQYTDRVEPLSLDEAFLDVTGNRPKIPWATRIAREIRQKILQQTGLTASAGVSFNKFLAKIASDVNKPDGLTVITPAMADAFIDGLPIGRFFGVGQATEQKMHRLGIRNGADLKRFGRADLVRFFGKAGHYFFDIAHGQDHRPVNPDRVRKSIGKETTLNEDIDDRPEMIRILERIALQLDPLIRQHRIRGTTLTLKVRYSDFQTVTRSLTLSEPVTGCGMMMGYVRDLLEKTEAGQKKVRLLGISISNLLNHRPEQFTQLHFPFETEMVKSAFPADVGI
ncbi:DNA polymerase IV [Desulfonema ishimotonii]|uniref:DNA polymerase IV n=1 Tax=Desulfonema ishimotonii TaxID=45657 RepID=A0A401FTI7_9BACT|nr:DNA polymerase IV [Desulfonema ishimotonii]GBC60279.1 DNA polymerase IV [Desulfonema ishimotonii]